MTSRIILAFDCAGRALSAALGRDATVLAARREERLQGHGERLFGLIDDLLAETGLGYQDLGMIAVTRGPGGFTGVRIGLAAARGLSLAGGQPIFAATTFDLAEAALSAEQRRGRQAVAVIDSKRRELFVQLRRSEGGDQGDPFAAAPEHLADLLPPGPLVLCGDGAAAAGEALRAAGRDVSLPAEAIGLDASRLVPLAAAADPQGLPPVRPLYLRPPDVTTPKPNGSGRSAGQAGDTGQ